MTRTEHLLACLAEECDEVGQRVMKALRFGLTEVQPGQDKTNAERIAEELTDLVAVLEMLHDAKALPPLGMMPERWRKHEKVEKYLRYSASLGRLTAEDLTSGRSSGSGI